MKFLKIREVKTPVRGTGKSAGIDFFIPSEFESRILYQGDSILIPTGFKVNVPEGYMFLACNKSGIATKYKLMVGAHVVDEDYQGEMHMHVINVGQKPVVLDADMKLVQFILVPVLYDPVELVESVDELYSSVTERGEGGFGSTGE